MGTTGCTARRQKLLTAAGRSLTDVNGLADVKHFDRDAVVVHTLGHRVDAGEAAVAGLGVGRVVTVAGAVAAVSAVIPLGQRSYRVRTSRGGRPRRKTQRD